MSLSMLLNSRHRFKLGIAGGAVVDWRYYEVMYTERYMGDRKDSEQFYEKADLKEQLGKLSTPVCLIHCDNDPVVLWQHTLSLLKKANSLNGIAPYISYYLFPGHLHNVVGKERVQLTLKIKSLIISYL
jgi:dipeptidyl-peptidase-4